MNKLLHSDNSTRRRKVADLTSRQMDLSVTNGSLYLGILTPYRHLLLAFTLAIEVPGKTNLLLQFLFYYFRVQAISVSQTW